MRLNIGWTLIGLSERTDGTMTNSGRQTMFPKFSGFIRIISSDGVTSFMRELDLTKAGATAAANIAPKKLRRLAVL